MGMLTYFNHIKYWLCRFKSNFESCVWRTVSSHSSHHPQDVLICAQRWPKARFISFFKPASVHCHDLASQQIKPVNPNAVLMLVHRLRRCININPALSQRILLADLVPLLWVHHSISRAGGGGGWRLKFFDAGTLYISTRLGGTLKISKVINVYIEQ